MKIHYQNSKGEEKILTDIIFLQNIDNETFAAVTTTNREFTLRTDRIEAIMSDEITEPSPKQEGQTDE